MAPGCTVSDLGTVILKVSILSKDFSEIPCTNVCALKTLFSTRVTGEPVVKCVHHQYVLDR